MNTVLAVAAGGALGAVSRHGFNTLVTALVGDGFPWGILLVNVLGCFAMGVVTTFLLVKPQDSETARLFLTTGFLGGFTTFSAFGLDIFRLMQSGENLSAGFYAVASVVLSVAAVFAGVMLVRAVAA